MRTRALALPVLCAALACATAQPRPFESESAFKSYVGGLGLSGVTAQNATARLEGEGFTCQPMGNVIAGAAQEIVELCRRQASGSCNQSQTIVMQLDWVGTPRVELAPGMRIKSTGTVLDPKSC